MVLLFVTTTMELGDRLLIFVCIICPQWEITHTVCFSWVANESAKRNQDLAALSASVKKYNRKLKPSYRFYYVILPVDQMRISHHSGSLWIILGSLLASFKCFSLSCHKYWINILIIETRSLACPVRIYIYILNIDMFGIIPNGCFPRWGVPMALGSSMLRNAKLATHSQNSRKQPTFQSWLAASELCLTAFRIAQGDILVWSFNHETQIWYSLFDDTIYIYTCERYDKETNHIQ